jgi:hypothetical protein
MIMALLSASWLGRFFVAGVRAPDWMERGAKPPMKIAVERLPDYCWRDLGFALPTRDEA